VKRTIEENPTGIRWDFTTKLEDLDFADDLASLPSKFQDIQQKTQSLHENASGVGLKININKTKTMSLNSNIKEQVKIDGKNIEDVDIFTYLGGVVTSKEGCDEDITIGLFVIGMNNSDQLVTTIGQVNKGDNYCTGSVFL
jgi:hypothetical protein